MRKKSEIPKLLIDNGVVTFDFVNGYDFFTGVKTLIYADNRLLIGSISARRKIINALAKIIKDKKINFDVIGGIATGGIPWAAFLAEKLNKPMIYIRPVKKQHGKKAHIEGTIRPRSKVLIIEDAICTGSSTLEAAKILNENGHKIKWCLCIFDYGLTPAKKNFSKAKIKYHALTSTSEVLDEAVKRKLISKEEKDKVVSWNRNIC
ncbi:MAG: orotate phosphoribosyltransferase [Nanoarchaeota archaeon]|nr:orotate phosphoribosyltransferase [Nanoarchaeota archaeon]